MIPKLSQQNGSETGSRSTTNTSLTRSATGQRQETVRPVAHWTSLIIAENGKLLASGGTCVIHFADLV